MTNSKLIQDDFIAEYFAKYWGTPGLLGLKLYLKWSNSVSNYHSCPRGGVTNWGRYNPDLPTHYPGWHGRVWFLYENETSQRMSAAKSGLHTGTGGYGLYNTTDWTFDDGYPQGYDCRIFAADHPELAKIEMMYRLDNTAVSFISLWKRPV